MIKNAPFKHRLAWAWQGIGAAYREENSFRTQARVAVATLAALMLLRPGWLWAMAIVLLVGLVLMAELFNTAIEAVLDGLHPGEGAFVRKAKDCAAAAVLVASTVAVLGGLAMLCDVLPARLA